MESISSVNSMVEPTRSLTAEVARTVGVGRLVKSSSNARTIPFAKLKALLDSRSDRDIIDGLQRVIAMIYMNKPCSPYFSSVVKNVANPNIEIKKLVYIYLLHYAESDPDLALLSVNAIQKSLTDQNPQVRAMALRTMAGMRVPVISQIVLLAIKRAIADLSPMVRKAAALAIPKCYRLDPNTLPQLIDHLSVLLSDKQYYVVGPAVQTFLDICPERIDLLHKHYRGLVKKLVDMDEWGQLATLKVLLNYARRCFPRTTQTVVKSPKKDFYDEDMPATGQGEEVSIMNPDLISFLNACQLLLLSQNSAVILSAATCLISLGDKTHLLTTIGPLIALMRATPDFQPIVLQNITLIALDNPEPFLPYIGMFFITFNDTNAVWTLKLELLTIIFPAANSTTKSLILHELEQFAHSDDIALVRASVQAIGRCAQSDSASASKCFQVLLDQISSFDHALVSEVLTVMRHLIQRDPPSHNKTIVRLARNLDSTSSPEARATIIWLVGEYGSTDRENNIAPDVFRILMKNFADESEEAKLQIILLGAKVYLQYIQELSANQMSTSHADTQIQTTTSAQSENAHQDASAEPHTRPDRKIEPDPSHPIPALWTYLLSLVRYDPSYDVRDRMRLFKNLLSDTSSIQLATLVILAPKPVPYAPSPSDTRKGIALGTATLALGPETVGRNGLPGYEDIPDWVELGREPDSSLRHQDEDGEYISERDRGIMGGADRAGTGVAASRRLDEAVREQGLEGQVRKGVGQNVGKLKGEKPKTLDAWLDEPEDEDSGEEEGEEDGSEDESDEESDSGSEAETSSEEESEEDTRQQQRQGLMRNK